MNMQKDERRGSPYRGLEPFEESDAAFFFGRERETRLITASLFAAPLTLLYGASGVGKSSVLRAGVMPRLRERRELIPVIFPTLAGERATTSASAVLRGWQTDPLGGIKETVALALFASAGEDRAARAAYQDVVLKHEMQSLREFLTACHDVSQRRIMLILDQFEEYSLYHPEEELFAEQFPKAIVSGDLSVSFLVSLREDALAKLDRFKGSIPTLWDSYRRVDHLLRSAAEDAIRLPLREYNQQQVRSTPIEIEDELVEAVLREVQTESVQFEETGSGTVAARPDDEGRIETPYLQLVMMRLWERELADESTILRAATLREEGGAAEIVRTHLDRVMEQFSPEEQDIAAKVFHRLVTPSGAKISFSVKDLAEYETLEPARLAPILRRLEEGSRRILRRVAMRSEATDEPRYEIFHDRLGKAILSWRAKRLKAQERQKRQREEDEQKQLEEKTRASLRGSIKESMDRLGQEGQATWARMMFYLVSTDGSRLAQTGMDLAKHSQQPPETVEAVLNTLLQDGILRYAYGSVGGSAPPRYEVAHAALAGGLLEWHAQYVLGQTREMESELSFSGLKVVDSPRPAAPESRQTRDFPYNLVRDALRKGRVVPFLGAGVSFSARPQNAPSGWDKTPFLPSNRELKELLARRCNFPPSEFEASDIAEVASFYVHLSSRDSLDALLRETLGRADYTPSATHEFVAETARSTPLLILTTNFDTLLEQALDRAHAPYDTVAYFLRAGEKEDKLAYTRYGRSRPELLSPGRINYSPENRSLIFRLNGPVFEEGQATGAYVITEEDQIDWIIRLQTTLGPFLQGEIRGRSLLSLGHSARDWSQRALLRTLYGRRSGESRTSWAVALDPAPLSVMAWQRYGVEVYSVELNEWAARMRDLGSGAA
jgi:hypothetical protein